METKTIEIVDSPTTAAVRVLAPACSSVLLAATDLMVAAPARDWTTGLGGAIAPAVRSAQGTGLSSLALSSVALAFGDDDRITGLPPGGAPV